LSLAIGLGAIAALGPAPAWAGDVASLVVEAETGRVVSQETATRRWYPASLTKVMTLYIAFEELAAGRLKLNEVLTASPRAASQSPTRLGLLPGSKITVREAVAATGVVSANDCAVLLAERISGSEAAFAQRMTQTAFRLGLSGTQYRNATGLPDSQQSTTARDMVLLGLAILRDYPGFYQLFALRQMPWNGNSYTTTNGFLSRYEGADGFKTGFTCGSGYNLLASSVRRGRRLIGAVLGSKGSEERHALMRRLFNEAFAHPAPGAKAPLVTDLRWEKAEEENVPPFQLTSFCNFNYGGRTVTDEAIETPEKEARKGQGKGKGKGAGNGAGKGAGNGAWDGDWGILFGQFPSQGAAQSALRRAQTIINGGRPQVVRRQDPQGAYWKALLIGFDHQGSARGCLQALERANLVCVVASPESLASKGLMERW
jgi:D-alanyl-D-alanine carboxypeptidase